MSALPIYQPRRSYTQPPWRCEEKLSQGGAAGACLRFGRAVWAWVAPLALVAGGGWRMADGGWRMLAAVVLLVVCMAFAGCAGAEAWARSHEREYRVEYRDGGGSASMTVRPYDGAVARADAKRVVEELRTGRLPVAGVEGRGSRVEGGSE